MRRLLLANSNSPVSLPATKAHSWESHPEAVSPYGLFLMSLMVLKMLGLFLYFALGPKSGVMSFFPRFWRRSS